MVCSSQQLPNLGKLLMLFQPQFFILPGESQGWGSLVGCHLWDRTEVCCTHCSSFRSSVYPPWQHASGSGEPLPVLGKPRPEKSRHTPRPVSKTGSSTTSKKETRPSALGWAGQPIPGGQWTLQKHPSQPWLLLQSLRGEYIPSGSPQTLWTNSLVLPAAHSLH